MAERWRPQNLDELQSYIASGVAEEGQFLEFKRELPSNRDTARHLAGLALDGGALVVGVDEPHPGEFEIRPLEHAGLPEKIGQIADTRVDQPVPVESHTLADASEPARGVIWVTIPPSPQAPHHVAGTYYKRADKRTVPITSDADLERLIRARRTTLEGIKSVLRQAMAEDTGELPHIVGVAQPIGADTDELYDAVGGRPGWSAFGNEVANALDQFQLLHGTFEPGRYRLASHHHHDRPKVSEGSYRELSLGYGGELRWLSEDGGLVGAQPNPQGVHRLLPESVVYACLKLLRAMLTVAGKTGRHRSWDVGIGVNRTRGLKSSLYRLSGFYDLYDIPPFPDEDYTSVLRVNHLQIENREWEVVRSLTHGFVEGCGFAFEAVAKGVGYSANEA